MRSRRRRVLPLFVAALFALGVVALTRPARHEGPVLYLHLTLGPYIGPGQPPMDIQYWIDAAGVRVFYAEALPSPFGPRLVADDKPIGRLGQPWYVISLGRRPDGACGVAYTTLLESSERGISFACASLLALKDVRGLQARLASLRQRYGGRARIVGDTVRVPVPAGTNPIPLVMDDFNMGLTPHIAVLNRRTGRTTGARGVPDETLAPGVLALDRRSGRPLSVSGYRRDGVTMTERILDAHMLPPNTLPGDFFDPPLFSLPDRAPAVYQWLRTRLPWRI